MATILPGQWRSSSINKSEIEKTVKDGAKVVCDRRKNKANELLEKLKNAENALAFFKDVLNDIDIALKNVKTSQRNDNINETAKDLYSLIEEYVKELECLHLRFANQKIRIISFGSKSQGKSSFTKKYTHLPDIVVSVKKSGNNDKTGATSIIIHKAGVSPDKPEIKVVLRTQDDILKIVNTCLSELSPCRLTINGNTSFSTWSDLYSILSNKKEKEQIYNIINGLKQPSDVTIKGFASMTEVLSEIFKPNSDFSEVNNAVQHHYFEKDKGMPIELKDLPMYNDMQCVTSCKYMTVSEIKIYVDLGHNGMFENIEVCDTKGMSVNAGGNLWEQELYKIIGNCDAAFSVQMSGSAAVGKSDQEFYVNLNKERKIFPESLKDLELRHYAIINAVDGTNLNDIDNLIKTLGRLNITRINYVGALKDDSIFDGITLNMQDFVDYVIYDMMKNVIITTNTTDQHLLMKCNEYPEKIEKKRNELILALSSFDDIPTKDWDEIIKRIIKTKRDDIIVELREWAKEQKVFIPTANTEEQNPQEEPGTSSKKYYYEDEEDEDSPMSVSSVNTAQENLKLPEENHDASVSEGLYKMITGKQADKIIKNKSYDEIIKIAIGGIFDLFIDKTGVEKGQYNSNLIGSSTDFGAYIDDLAQYIYDYVHTNINLVFAPDSKNPGVDSFRKELFIKIWKAFSLDSFFENKEFCEEILKNPQEELKSERIKKWHKCYETTGGSEGGTPILPRTSYSILNSYFKTAETPSEEKLNSGEIIFDKDQLRTAVINAYLYHDYVGRYMEKQRNAAAGKRALLTAVLADLRYGKFVEELFSLYKTKSPFGYIKQMIEIGMISKDDEKEYEAQQYVESLKTTKIRLLNTVIKL